MWFVECVVWNDVADECMLFVLPMVQAQVNALENKLNTVNVGNGQVQPVVTGETGGTGAVQAASTSPVNAKKTPPKQQGMCMLCMLGCVVYYAVRLCGLAQLQCVWAHTICALYTPCIAYKPCALYTPPAQGGACIDNV